MSLPTEQLLLERFMKLSIATAVATIALKVVAAAATGSVGFLSDALESGVNLVAAVVGFVAIKIAAKPQTQTTSSATARPSMFPRW